MRATSCRACSRPCSATSPCSTCTTTSGRGATTCRRRASIRCAWTCTFRLGAGTLPWARVAGALRDHDAPLMLEIGTGVRQEPLVLGQAARAALDAAVTAAAPA